MGEVIEKEQGLRLSISRLATEFGMARETVAKRITGINPAGKRNGYPIYRLRDVAAAIVDAAPHQGDPEAFDPRRLPPKERLDWIRSEREWLKHRIDEREVIPAGEVEQVIATALAALAQGLRATPDHLERRHGIDPAVAVAVGEIIDAELDALANRLKALAADALIIDDEDAA